MMYDIYTYNSLIIVKWNELNNFYNSSGLVCYRCYHPAIPASKIKPRLNTANHPVNVDLQTVQLLERLSLVDFANVDGLQRLEVW